MNDGSDYIVSACLAGIKCRYDGTANSCQPVIDLIGKKRACPVCPESLSGLKIPRAPCEQFNGRVINRDGLDVTEKFMLGARRALQKALATGARRAIVKSRSPSCGFGQIYDGSFSRKLCAGNGLWTQLLLEHGFEIFTEDNLPPEISETILASGK